MFLGLQEWRARLLIPWNVLQRYSWDGWRRSPYRETASDSKGGANQHVSAIWRTHPKHDASSELRQRTHFTERGKRKKHKSTLLCSTFKYKMISILWSTRCHFTWHSLCGGLRVEKCSKNTFLDSFYTKKNRDKSLFHVQFQRVSAPALLSYSENVCQPLFVVQV